jgi:lysozyme
MADLSPRLLNAVKGFEGYRATPFWDFKQYTSGYGTKASSPFENIDRATAESRLQDELSKAARSVDTQFPNLAPGQRDALISLTYNAGPGWMNGGLGNAIRSGNADQAKALFSQYNHAGGQVNPGLTNRRQAELGWWDGQQPVPPMPIPMPQQAAPNLPLFPQNAQANAAPQQPPVTPMPDSVWQQAFALSPQPNTPSSIWQTLGVPPSQAPQGLGWLDPKYQNTFGG